MESLDNPMQENASTEATLEPIAPTLAPLSKEEHDRIFRRGRRWLGLGVFLMGLSFSINFLLFDSDTSFVTVMYVLTSLGVLCIMKCLADILGF